MNIALKRIFGGLTGALLLAASTTSAQTTNPTLPSGSYTLFVGNDSSANFIVERSVTRSDDRVNLAIYRIYVDSLPLPRGARDQELIKGQINCATRTWRLLGVDAFTATGEWVGSLPAEAETPILPDQTWDFAARIVCGEVRMPPSATVSGHVAARALGLSRLRGS